jgi:hypothetical protein
LTIESAIVIIFFELKLANIEIERISPMKPALKQFVTDSEGNKKAVIIPLKEYEKLMEDMHDLAIIAERRDEKPISFEELKRRLKRIGKL